MTNRVKNNLWWVVLIVVVTLWAIFYQETPSFIMSDSAAEVAAAGQQDQAVKDPNAEKIQAVKDFLDGKDINGKRAWWMQMMPSELDAACGMYAERIGIDRTRLLQILSGDEFTVRFAPRDEAINSNGGK